MATMVSREALRRLVTPEVRRWAKERAQRISEPVLIIESPYEGERGACADGVEGGILLCLTAAEAAERGYPEWAVIAVEG